MPVRFHQMSCASPKAVLVVDDEELIRMIAADALSEAGVTIFEAGTAVEALNVLEHHPAIALLFTDINMPGEMDGLALAERVHRLHPEIELIVTSGRLSPGNQSLPDHGTFLPKPYRTSDLVSLVEEKLHT